ncbi:CynX/NimT family MFS transporter [Geminicoccus sp.]|uniref:MFS transporter n=1 Tax=Geminicoccus sp. TaxID=2024832 RepID=UPI002E349CDB|nr:MFS transporter [Geminicoccus sp.]
MARWLAIGWLYLMGVIAAAQLGKMSALLPLIQADLMLGLTTAALVVSLLELGGATIGLMAGRAIARIGYRRALLAGIALLALAGLGEGLAGGAVSLLAWRVVEGVAYLAVVIAAPLLIMQTALPNQRGVALALWSSFVPVGLALGAILSGIVADLWSWRGALVGGSAIAFAAAICTLLLPIGRHGPVAAPMSRPARPGPAAWKLTMAFGCYTAFEVGLLALLPIFLVDRAGASTSAAGLVTGIASFVTVLGSFVAAWQAHARRGQRLSMVVAIILPAAMLFLVFQDAPVPAVAATAAIVLNAISGIFPGLAFAMLPQVARTDRELASANGLFTQFGAAGSLLGPPLFAACAGSFGWWAAAACGAVASIGCLVLMMSVTKVGAAPSASCDLAENST